MLHNLWRPSSLQVKSEDIISDEKNIICGGVSANLNCINKLGEKYIIYGIVWLVKLAVCSYYCIEKSTGLLPIIKWTFWLQGLCSFNKKNAIKQIMNLEWNRLQYNR